MRRRRRVACAVAATALMIGAGATAASAVIGDDEGSTSAYRFVAAIRVGDDRGCSGALIAPQWVITATVCFGADAQAGPPAAPVTVTVGRTDRSVTTGGYELGVTRIEPAPNRGVTLARLSAPVHDVPPVAITTQGPPAEGAEVRLLGFGRSATRWVPDRLTGATVTVGTVDSTTYTAAPASTGADAPLCKGDAGGPAVRAPGGVVQLVSLHLTSGQRGCLEATGGTATVTEARVDDLIPWVNWVTKPACNLPGAVAGQQDGMSVTMPDVNADCVADVIGNFSTGELRVWQGTGVLAEAAVLQSPARLVGTGWTTGAIPRIVVGDVTGDNKTDILKAQSDGGLVAWAGTGNLSADAQLFNTTPQTVGSGWTTANVPRILTGDFNGDGRTDLGAAFSDGQVRIWGSSGQIVTNGLFPVAGQMQALGLTTAAYPRVFTADLDGDRRTDLLAQASDGRLLAYRSTGDVTGAGPTFVNPPVLVGSGWTTAFVPRIVVGDWNGDERTDIAAVYSDGTMRAWNSLGFPAPFAGGGSLSSPGFTTAAVSKIVVGDLDRDGRADVTAQHTDGRLLTWRATGDASGANTMFPGSGTLTGVGFHPSTFVRLF